MKKFFRWIAETSATQRDVALLSLRLWFGLALAFGHGLSKVANFTAWNAKVIKMGVPAPEVVGTMTALSEFLGGIFLALGLLTRGAAAAVMTTMLGAAFFVHRADPFFAKGGASKEMALMYAVAALALLLAGPGRLSADKLLFARGTPSVPSPGAIPPLPTAKPARSEHDGKAGLHVEKPGKKDPKVKNPPA